MRLLTRRGRPITLVAAVIAVGFFASMTGSADAGSESGTIYWTGGVTGDDIRMDSRYSDADFADALQDDRGFLGKAESIMLSRQDDDLVLYLRFSPPK